MTQVISTTLLSKTVRTNYFYWTSVAAVLCLGGSREYIRAMYEVKDLAET